MKNKNRAGVISTTWIASIMVFTIILIIPAHQRITLENSLNRAVRMYRVGYASIIKLDDFTEFDWDLVHLFPPYTSDETIIKTLGTYWNEAGMNRLALNEDIVLLVFTKNGKVIRWAEAHRNIADYSTVVDHSPLTPETALFFLPLEDSAAIQILR